MCGLRSSISNLRLSLSTREFFHCPPFHVTQEPPLSEVLDYRNDEDEFVPTDERQPEITGPVHHVWVVQISFTGVRASGIL